MEPTGATTAQRRLVFTERHLRLTTGCVLFLFATTHFFNAGLGLFGIEAADAGRKIIGSFWEALPCRIVLWGSFLTHYFLGLKNIAFRRSWRMPAIEATQITLGFLIPFLGAAHFVAVRGVPTVTHVEPDYRTMFLNLWPGLADNQALLLLVVWIHGCIGLFMAFRMRGWFARWRDVLLAGAVGWPLFALAGLVAGGREAVRRFPEGPSISPLQVSAFNAFRSNADLFLYICIGAALLVFVIRHLATLRGRSVVVRYADGQTLRVTPGATLLEVSRANGIPHAAVCGGRARCSTCRVRILDGSTPQPDPEQAERRLLARIGAPESVRLACQLRPAGDIAVQPLVDAGSVRVREQQTIDPFRWGVERRVTLMFCDIRGFTSISERNFAFDIVFVLNRFLTRMSQVIEANGGRIDKYLGDGLMAIFGADGASDGSRQALIAARDMVGALDALNLEFSSLLKANIRIGVGLHTGPAILGRIGGGTALAGVTALGDTVNIAARLEELTKSFGAVCVASQATLSGAGVDLTAVELQEADVRGRKDPIHVHAIRDLASFPVLGAG